MGTNKNVMTRLLAAFAIIALAVSAAACSFGGTLEGDWDEDNYVVTAKNADDGYWMMIGYSVEEGSDALVVTSNLEKGTIIVTLGSGLGVDATLEDQEAATDPEAFSPDETIIEIEVTGSGEQVIPVEPGDYSLAVAGVAGDPATGTVTIGTMSQQ